MLFTSNSASVPQLYNISNSKATCLPALIAGIKDVCSSEDAILTCTEQRTDERTFVLNSTGI